MFSSNYAHVDSLDGVRGVAVLAARVGAAADRIVYGSTGYRRAYDLGQLGHLIVFLVGADVERFVVDCRSSVTAKAQEMSWMWTIGRHGVSSLMMRIRPVVWAQQTKLFRTTSARRRAESP